MPVNMRPSRHAVSGHSAPAVRNPGASTRVGPIVLKEAAPSGANSKPKNMFNASVQRDAEASQANERRANAPIPQVHWHIPGIDGPGGPVSKMNVMAKMEPSAEPAAARNDYIGFSEIYGFLYLLYNV